MTAIACLMALGCQAQQQTDEFTTKSGKKVRFTCIKHSSIQINYNGQEIEVDPVGKGMKPETDYAQFPKADIILVTHEHQRLLRRSTSTLPSRRCSAAERP